MFAGAVVKTALAENFHNRGDNMTNSEKLDLLLDKVAVIEDKVNEIRVNIQRVAEGHLDLSRNLHEP